MAELFFIKHTSLVNCFLHHYNKNKPPRVRHVWVSNLSPSNSSPSSLLSPLHPFLPPPLSAVVSQSGQGTGRRAAAQDTQTGCQATAAKDHHACTHVCVSVAHMFVCVPARVLIIKNKHAFLLVGQCEANKVAHANVSKGFQHKKRKLDWTQI